MIKFADMKKYFLALIAFSFLLFSCAPASDVGWPEVKVACIGDSITWGAGLDDRFSQSWPVVLGRRLGDGYAVRNFGYNSRTASREGDFPYLNAAKYDTLKMWLPDVVTIMLGTNDSKPHNWDAVQYHEGLRALIDDLRKVPSHPKIVLVTPTPAGGNGCGIRDSVIRECVLPELERVAVRRSLDLVDVYGPMREHMNLFPDGVHPDAEGSALIASIVCDALGRCGVKPGPRVMFVGDSITDGFWGRNDSRPTADRNHYDLNHVFGHGYQAIAIGRLMLDRPELNIRCFNRGKGGDNLEKIRTRWNEDVMSVRPTVISLLVGVNDVSSGSEAIDCEAWEASYRDLIDKTVAELPAVKFVLCTPFVKNESGFVRGRDDSRVEALAAIVRRIASDYDLPCVDFAAVIESLYASAGTEDIHYWLWDGIHPTYATHLLFAEEWIKTVYKHHTI